MILRLFLMLQFFAARLPTVHQEFTDVSRLFVVAAIDGA
jgi:hypothetical protein